MQQVYLLAGTRLCLFVVLLGCGTRLLSGYGGNEAKETEANLAGEPFDSSPKNIESRLVRGELSTGVPYAFLPKKSPADKVHFHLNLRFGDDKSLFGKSAAVRMLGDLMLRGTNTRSLQHLKDRTDQIKAIISFSSELQTLNVIVETQPIYFIEVLDLVTDMLRNPALDEGELTTLRNLAIARLMSLKNDPDELTKRAVLRVLNPFKRGDARYLPTIDEEIDDYKKLGLQHIKEIHSKYLSGTEGEVAVVGDFDCKETEEKLSAMLSNWKSKIAYQRIAASATTDVKSPVLSIETPDNLDARYFACEQYAIRDDHPKYAELLIGTLILGGDSSSSRLGMRIRQEAGLANEVAAQFVASQIDERASFSISAISKPQNRDKLAKMIEEEIRKFAKDGIAEKELKDSIQVYLQKQRMLRSDDANLSKILAGNLFTGRNMEYYEKLEAEVAQLNVEHVNNAVGEFVSPDSLVIAIAGDFVKPTSRSP